MLTKEEVRDKIQTCFGRVFKERCPDHPLPKLDGDSILLEIGLDSLGFAVLILELEDELGYDPFVEAAEAYYPQTYDDFVNYYFAKQP